MKPAVKIPRMIFALLICSVAFSCSPLKYVPKDDKLYTGSSIISADSKLAKDQRQFLTDLATPKPNSKFLGIRWRLMLFNMFKEPKKPKGIIHTIKRKWGEPPALLSQARPTITEGKMRDYLFSLGFLQPEVHQQLYAKERKASISYEVRHGTR